MSSADDYIKRHQRNAVHPGTAFLCPEDQIRKLEYRNQEELTAHIEEVFLDPQRIEPFSIHHINWMHKITAQGLYPSAGHLRRGAETVQISGASFTPSHGTEVEPHLRDLLDEIREIAETPLGPGECIIRAAKCFHRFEVIHPFLEGNGRVGRGLLHLMLYEFKILVPPQQIYDYIEAERKQYIEVLEKADDGNFVPLSWFITDAVIDTDLQRFFDYLHSSHIADHVMRRLKREERQFMSRSHRLRMRRDARAKMAHQVNKRLKQILNARTN